MTQRDENNKGKHATTHTRFSFQPAPLTKGLPNLSTKWRVLTSVLFVSFDGDDDDDHHKLISGDPGAVSRYWQGETVFVSPLP
jgi:hypothetical protein